MTADFRVSESGSELLARLKGRSSLKNLEPRLFTEEGLASHGDAVEFYGPEGTGKSEMLYHLVVSCILPELAGGLQVEVLFIDTDYHFDMLRLVTILERRLPQGTEDTVKGCLSRLYLVQCGGSTQLLLLLHSLEALVCSHPALCLLIVDSISAFYWMDRLSGGESINQQEASLCRCIEHLEKLLSEYHLVLVATTQALMHVPGSGVYKSDGVSAAWLPLLSTAAQYKPYLCKSWQRLVKHRLVFSKCNNNARDNKLDFTIVSLHPKSSVVSKCAFTVTDGGIQFL
ncbi:DNA repair protein XRCC2 isoform X1 [Callorhinchus milii]|uniref:DNA repair protein XRCC2 n=1 Tax=Callorhinchus milii TaxID=7868 RepID=V9KX15_CALMI|nr:DNA repair protein XRCC2 isoform X1 [Callorhinchus milii]|eukprot:gi/632982220/ref/XP_007908018.1/ PREDICTED: DNA repair protein XRCC2 isoform X1 [Callorhinchus milii]